MNKTITEHKAKAILELNFALIVCSTSRYKEFTETGHADDYTGDLIIKVIKAHGHRITMRKIVLDNRSMIQKVLMKALKSRKINVIITSGGTGISPKDVTIEAVQPLLEKKLPGFGELFRTLSYKTIGSASLLSRAIGGVTKGKVIFCLPGSPQSVTLALEKLILPEAGHILRHTNES
jgi:molybdenum cofactor biosynthesis protein B